MAIFLPPFRAAPNFLPWHEPLKNTTAILEVLTKEPGRIFGGSFDVIDPVELGRRPDFVWHSHPEKPLSPRMVASAHGFEGVCS